ncbi:unnamed protein product [Calypogeia fissa]
MGLLTRPLYDLKGGNSASASTDVSVPTYAIPVSTRDGTEIAWRSPAPKPAWKPPYSYTKRLEEEARSSDINVVNNLTQLERESRAASPIQMIKKAQPSKKPLSPWQREDFHTTMLNRLKS